MIGGVNFQPGARDDRNRINPNAPNGTQEGVQEAIKVLSLRLPKVVGANAVAPSPLLTAPGSQGNSRVDSIVAQVMQKYFPTGDAPSGQAPSWQEPLHNMFRQISSPPQGLHQQDVGENRNAAPRIISDTPMFEAPMTAPSRPGIATPDSQFGGGSIFNGMFEPAPALPDLKQYLNWLPQEERQDQPLI